MSLNSLISTGTRVWLDSIDPQLVERNFALGVTGANSSLANIADLLKTSRFDDDISELFEEGMDDADVTWHITDSLVHDAQEVFFPVWQKTKGNDGYVSIELDPQIEDITNPIPHAARIKKYLELGKKWAMGHQNRMIKVPATAAGLDSLEGLSSMGLSLNVTHLFSERQYKVARDNIWKGAQKRKSGLILFKSIYSISVARTDSYTAKFVPELSQAVQGQAGIINARKIWKMNQEFWNGKQLPLQQEISFACSIIKKSGDAPEKYVEALAGGDIQVNSSATNDAVEKLNKTYTRQIDQIPDKAIMDEITAKVDQTKMESRLMEETIAKFTSPFKTLLDLITEKRANLAEAVK